MSPQDLPLLLCNKWHLWAPQHQHWAPDAQLQTEILKSRDPCAKPVQAATILQLKGSKEAVSGAAASPAQIAEKTLLTFSHSTQALVKGTHKRCPVLWGKGSPKAWPLQPDTQLGDGASILISQKDI